MVPSGRGACCACAGNAASATTAKPPPIAESNRFLIVFKALPSLHWTDGISNTKGVGPPVLTVLLQNRLRPPCGKSHITPGPLVVVQFDPSSLRAWGDPSARW